MSGSSGVGIVAEGVVFTDGAVALRWLVAPCSTAFYAHIEDVRTIHGHEGRTQVVMLDQAVPCAAD